METKTAYRVELQDEFKDDPESVQAFAGLGDATAAYNAMTADDPESVQTVILLEITLERDEDEWVEVDINVLEYRTVADVRETVQQQIDLREAVARWAADEYAGTYSQHSHGYYVSLPDGRTIRIKDHAANPARLERGDLSIVISPFREEREKADLFDVLCDDREAAIAAIKNWA